MNAKAIYSESIQKAYSGNPLIEALPDPMSIDEIYEQLSDLPSFDERERIGRASDRLQSPAQLLTCFQPLSIHIDMVRKIYGSIIQGYQSRNPLLPAYSLDLSQLHSSVISKDSDFLYVNLSNAVSSGSSIVGYSGVGKTSSVKRILAQYPQTISHQEYRGEPFNHKQIVWMRLECPIDGSIKGLCTSFFIKFDELTGDHTYVKYVEKGRNSTDQMIPQIALIARRHSLGVLFIDEIQNISASKSGGAKRMMNFLANIVNTIGVPIFLVGIPEALPFLSNEFMISRRATGTGAIIMKPFPFDSVDWNIFLTGIWDYQWTNTETPLNEKISQRIHKLSGGIVAVAINLYIAVQEEAIKNGELGKSEEITLKLIDEVAKSPKFCMISGKIESINRANFNLQTAKKLCNEEDVLFADNPEEIMKKRASKTSNQIRDDDLQRRISLVSNTGEQIDPLVPYTQEDFLNMANKVDADEDNWEKL